MSEHDARKQEGSAIGKEFLSARADAITHMTLSHRMRGREMKYFELSLINSGL